jgi:hypothetical protein
VELVVEPEYSFLWCLVWLRLAFLGPKQGPLMECPGHPMTSGIIDFFCYLLSGFTLFDTTRPSARRPEPDNLSLLSSTQHPSRYHATELFTPFTSFTRCTRRPSAFSLPLSSQYMILHGTSSQRYLLSSIPSIPFTSPPPSPLVHVPGKFLSSSSLSPSLSSGPFPYRHQLLSRVI